MSDVKNLSALPFAGLDRLSGHLGYHAQRQEIIAGNLANLDTPGFRSRELSFEEHFSTQTKDGVSNHQLRQQSRVLVQDDETPDQDGNSVSLEVQMARSSSNILRYQTVSELLSRKLGMLHYAASDGQGK